LSALFDPVQHRQQQGRQNGDDRDDHQQFNQGETVSGLDGFFVHG
jgi:hypothetical protein